VSAKEIDTMLVWASGGVPQGDPTRRPGPVTFANDWPLGQPDLVLPLPTSYTLPADKTEEVQEFVLPAGLTQDRWIKAVDLLPGTPAIVRNAWISARTNRQDAPTMLAVWLPAQDPVPLAESAGFRLPAGADLVVRIRYRKTWKYEGKAIEDRSRVGIYFQDRPGAREVRELLVTSDPIAPEADGRTFTFTRTLDEPVEAFALRSEIDRPNVELSVDVVGSDGTRTPMIRLTTQPDWQRRCWFDRPLALPRGSRIEVKATLRRPEEGSLGMVPVAAAARPSASADSRLRLWIDVVPAQSKRASR
jgi:hypothetical protein